MPRASRHFIPGQLWHITHRCHEKAFLLKFPRATAIEADGHLQRCLVYIDLNMVRAGVVKHPAAWEHGGYQEIQDPPERYTLIELNTLSALCGFADVAQFQRAHRQWVEQALLHEALKRDERWSEALAVGSRAFVEKVRHELALKARHRDVDEADGTYALREPAGAYTCNFGTESDVLRAENAVFWAHNPVNT